MSQNYLSYLYLALAIVAEVCGTTFMQKSEQFSKLGPSLVTAVCYLCTFYLLSQSLKTIPLGVAYGIWGSLGIVLTAIIGFVVFKQKLDVPAMIGIGMMVGGVVVVQVFSKTVSH